MEAPRVVVISIIFRENKFLLVKRGREPFEGFWSIVGGLSIMKEKYSSDPLQASKDEVMCDLCCDFLDPTFYQYTFRNEEKPTICLYFYGDISGIPKINTKYVSEYDWFSIEEINNLELAFEHKKILQKFAKEFVL